MEFDESKVLTVVTADQARKGQRGWVACTLETLIEKVTSDEQTVQLSDVLNTSERKFRTEKNNKNFGWSIFYPAPESTPVFKSLKDYVLAELDWAEQNHVWSGAKVMVVKPFLEKENGCGCYGSDIYYVPTSIIGEKFTVKNVVPKGINLLYSNLKRKDGSVSSWFTAPFYALEVVEPIKDESVFESAEYQKTMNAFRRYADGIETTEPAYPTFKVGDTVVVQRGVLSTEQEIATVIDPCGKDDFMFVDNNKVRCGLKKHLCKLITYRQFANAEEFKPYRDEWFRVKHDGGMLRICAYNDKGVQEANGKFNTYQIFFEKAERENGEPCGVREEA